MDLFDIVLKYASIALLGVLGVFVLFGMLCGMGRGFKRSFLRLVLYVGLLVGVFLLTPVVTNFILNLDITIFGKTPNGWVDFCTEKLVVFLQETFGKYVSPFGSYIQDFALGIVLSIVNIVLFMVLYFVMKFVSWIIYSIVAHFWAPKRDRNGNKLPKHAFGGMLIGALQGIALFVFFMLPVNGVLGIVHQAAQYQNMQDEHELAAAQAYSDEDGEINLEKVFTDIDNSLALYNKVLRYTGLQAISNKAFEYQLTVRIEGAEAINLVNDVNTAWELYVDAQAVPGVVDKFNTAMDTNDFTVLTGKDFKVLRSIVNKTFDLQVLNIADWFLADLDNVLNTPFEENETKLEGTDIYEDSIYGMLVKACATTRVVEEGKNNQKEFAAAVRGLVKYVADQKLEMFRHDALTILDLAEKLTVLKINFNGEDVTVAKALSDGLTDWKDILALLTARIASEEEQANTPVINVLGNTLKELSLVKMIGLPGTENIIVYSNFCDTIFGDFTDAKDLVYGLAELFLGEDAFNHDAVQGGWERFGGLLLDTAEVLNENTDLIEDIITMVNEEDMEMQALINLVGDLIITEEYYNEHSEEFDGKEYAEIKFQKVDNLLAVVHEALNAFEPVKKFIDARFADMNSAGDNELLTMLVELINADLATWESKFHGLVSAANIMNNEAVSEVLNKIQDPESGEFGTEDVVKLLDVVQQELDAETVVDLVDTVVNLPEVGDSIKETLSTELTKLTTVDPDTGKTVLGEIFENEDDLAAVQGGLDTLNKFLTGPDGEGNVVDKEDLESAVSGLLDVLGDIDFEEILKNLNATEPSPVPGE